MKYLLFIFIFLKINVFAQDIYRKGTIVLKNGETLSGYISYIFDSKSIRFKQNNKAKRYTSSEIKRFEIDGNIYVSKSIIPSNYVPNNFLALAVAQDQGPFYDKVDYITEERQDLFLHALIYGKMKLYELKRRDNFKLYYAENESKIVELPPPLFKVINDSLTNPRAYKLADNFAVKYLRLNVYVDSLKKLMLEDDNFYDKNLNFPMEYSLKSFSEIIYNYNLQYKDSTKYISTKINNKKVLVSISAGVSRPSNKTSLNMYALLPAYGFNNNMLFKVGYQYFDEEFKAISLGLRYLANKGSVRPFVGAALTRNIKYRNFPSIIEYGFFVPVKGINIVFEGNIYPPFRTKTYDFRVFSYNVGIIF